MTKRTLPWRTLIGLALIALSAVSVVLMVGPSRQTAEVLVAARNIVPGEELTDDNTDSIEVPASPLWENFARPLDANRGLSSTGVIQQGDVIAQSGLVGEAQSDDATVTLGLSVGSPRWLAPGASVDVWVAAPGGENSFLLSFVAAPGAVIVEVRREEGFAADSRSSQVDVAIARRFLPGVVHALANNYFVYVTPRTESPQ